MTLRRRSRALHRGARGRLPGRRQRTRLHRPVHAAGRRRALGADDRRRRQPATATLFAAAPDPAAMAALGAEGIAPHIKTLGLWQAQGEERRRAVAPVAGAAWRRGAGRPRRARSAARRRPQDRQRRAQRRLRRRPPWRSTRTCSASATAPASRRARRCARSRTGWSGASRAPMLRPAHHWLILHGRYVCKARRPECWRCVAAAPCRFPDKTPGAGRGRYCGTAPRSAVKAGGSLAGKLSSIASSTSRSARAIAGPVGRGGAVPPRASGVRVPRTRRRGRAASPPSPTARRPARGSGVRCRQSMMASCTP